MKTKGMGYVVLALVSLQVGCWEHHHGRGGYGAPGYGPPPPGYAQAGPRGGWYGMAGCGLGSLIFGPDDEPVAQVLAATTNGTFGTQTFGITSGTSNCVSGGVLRAEREQAAFAEVNFRDLKRNMAAGGGEYLRSFSTLLGCEDSARPALFKMTQDRFAEILPTEQAGPIDLLVAVKAEIRADPQLANSCSDERAIARTQQSPSPSHIPSPIAGTDQRRQRL
jgi:Protein of unknown function (DUF3015)